MIIDLQIICYTHDIVLICLHLFSFLSLLPEDETLSFVYFASVVNEDNDVVAVVKGF